jgi:hypothetical protein
MEVSTVLSLVKARHGISTTVRDTYLTAIINGVIKELEDEKGLSLDGDNPYHLIFVVDYVSWRYENKGAEGNMPRHLQFRLHNLIIHVGSTNLDVNSVIFVDILPEVPEINTVYICTDGTKQMYLDDIWTTVDLVNGFWMVII